jgi:hypothetical protein
MTREQQHILIRWAGTRNKVWDAWYPLSHDEQLGLGACEKCDAQVDFLILHSNVTDQEIQQALHDLRDRITGPCGKHRLPKTGELQPSRARE